MAKKKLTNLKSDDCHVLMTILLTLVLCGILPENVRLTIMKLCDFFNTISHKIIDPDMMAGKRASDGPPPRQQRQNLILIYLNSIK